MERGEAEVDKLLLLPSLGLTLLGIIMVYSASAAIGLEKYRDPCFFLKRQGIALLLGGSILILAYRTPYLRWCSTAYPLLVLVFVLLILVLVSPWGREVGGARRWLAVGPFSFQPSEVGKLAMILYLAHSFTRKGEKMHEFVLGLLPYLLVLGLLFLLLLLQPDLGTAIQMATLAFLLLFVAGVRPIHLFISGACLLPLLWAAVSQEGYRLRRLLAFLDPWKDPTDSGFQIIQSFLALGRGGVWGVGLGEGRQKLFYLPEAHTDFILAVVGEELGLLGLLLVLSLMGTLVARGCWIALRCPDSFGRLLAIGISLSIGVQAGINLGVITGLLPTKGMPFPYMSAGGSALVMTLWSTGILLNISKEAREPD